tara:strand:+ start:1841 stop:2128 length:288 start_codon:yes stop_codon:yes gene_type:complete
MLLSSQRKFLRAKAHHLKPQILIGKNEISEGVLNSIDESLNSNELIKVKFHEGKIDDERKSIIVDNLKCEIAGCIGKTMILFRQNKDKDKQKIKF